MVKLRWEDMTIGIFSSTSYALGVFMIIMTPYGNHYLPYIGAVLNLLSGTCLPVVKSSLTKIIPQNEIAYLLAVVGMLQAFSALGAPVSNLIYSGSIDWCDSIGGEKDWCSTIFLWMGFTALLVNCVLFFLTRLRIKSTSLRDSDIISDDLLTFKPSDNVTLTNYTKIFGT